MLPVDRAAREVIIDVLRTAGRRALDVIILFLMIATVLAALAFVAYACSSAARAEAPCQPPRLCAPADPPPPPRVSRVLEPCVHYGFCCGFRWFSYSCGFRSGCLGQKEVTYTNGQKTSETPCR